MSLVKEKLGKWSYFRLKRPDLQGFVYGFFSKECPNLYSKGDAKSFLEAFGLTRFVIMKQEHKDKINVVQNGERPKVGDGIIVLERRVGGVIKTADCLPIVIFDLKERISAIVHAGYNGSLLKITKKAVEKMISYGSKGENLLAVIGPGIRSCCYDVPLEREAMFRQVFEDHSFIVRRDGRVYLDLGLANRILLEESGVKEIFDTGLCTFCHPELFYSFRRGDKDRRQISFVSIA